MSRDPFVKTKSGIRTMAFLGTYLPRKGSIAKFEQGSAAAVQSRLQGEVGYAEMPNRSVMKSA
jgi:hypothetical protein